MENKIIGLGDSMKDLKTVLEAVSIELSQSKKVRCNECPYNGEYDDGCDCTMHLLDDLLGHIEGLREENERLTKCMDSKNNYEETIKSLSDMNHDLLEYIKLLKEDNKLLKEDNKEFIEQIFRMKQSL